MEVKKVASLFSEVEIKATEVIVAGHINNSYLVSTFGNDKYILQKINQNVFKNPGGVIANLIKINDYLIALDYPYQVAKLLYTKKEEPYFIEKTNFWRAIEYIENSRNILVCPNRETAFYTGKAYGHFIKSLSGFEQRKIEIVIPDFHDPQKRYTELELSIKTNFDNRVIEAGELIEKAIKYKDIISEYKQVTKDLPIRMVHNDTKLSNLLFNIDLSEVKAIIDLDTVMPGYLINDFGDMVRSICNPAEEDEMDLKKVVFNVDYYIALRNGFLNGLCEIISKEEESALTIGIKAVIYTQFIRFLSDYLNGDNYYSLTYQDQNLKRARVQSHLLIQVIDLEVILKNIS